MEYLQALRIREALVEMLARHEWRYFITITFAQGTMSPYTAKNRYYKYLHEVRSEAKSKSVNFFVGVEPHKTGFYHLHILLGEIENICKFCLWVKAFQMYGRSTVSDYDQTKGAAFYLTKYVTKGYADWDMWIKKKGK
jgi:hypothetical protein